MKRLYLLVLMVAILAFAFANCDSPALSGGKVYQQQGNTEKAKEQFLAALESNPDNAEAHKLLGDIFSKEGEFEKMNEHFDACLAISPRFKSDIENVIGRVFSQNYNLGVKYIKAAAAEEDEEQANKIWREAIIKLKTSLIIKEDVRAYEGLAAAHMSLNENSTAHEYFDKVLAEDPKNKQALRNLGIMLYIQAENNDNDKELFKESLKYLEDFAKYYPDEIGDAVELGLCYEKLELDDKALAFYEDLLKIDPNNVGILIQMGVKKFFGGDEEGAIKDFEKALELEPDNIIPLRNIAFSLFYKSMGKIQEGTDTIEEWKVIQPYMEKIVKIDPKDDSAWEALSIIYIKLGMKEKSDEAAAKVKELRKTG